MPRIVHQATHRRLPPTTEQVRMARDRLDTACVVVARVLDGGDRDPTWHETQELENAAIALGRLLR